MTTDFHKLPRLYVTNILSEGSRFFLDKDQSHYLVNVLRLQGGDFVRVFNAEYGEWKSSVTTDKKRNVEIYAIEQIRPPHTEQILWLCCAPIKRANFDFMIMKATELGVSHIQPIITDRTQVREINSERCSAIATEAAEQSERLSVPVIMAPVAINHLTTSLPPNCLSVICAEFGNAVPTHEAFKKFEAKDSKPTAIIIGPEGGFTAEEMGQLKNIPQSIAIKLGTRILRAETAAIAALSCWQAISGDWKNT